MHPKRCADHLHAGYLAGVSDRGKQWGRMLLSAVCSRTHERHHVLWRMLLYTHVLYMHS